jgi:SAM-dependent methyltransferase
VKPEKFVTWEAAVSWLVDQPDKQDIVRACYFDSPLSAASDRYWRSDEWNAVRSFLPLHKGKALDVGAGRGIASYALAKDGWQVVALEPDPSDLVGTGAIRKLAKDERLPIEIAQEFGESLPFADATFDAVFARQVLHHARDLKQLCREISRVLKPSGRFIAIRDHVLKRKTDMDAFLANHALHHLYGGENAYLFNEYKAAITEAPLEIEQVYRSFQSALHYGEDEIAELRLKAKQRLGRLPLLKPLAAIAMHDAIFPTLLRFASHFDSRPGASVSFICRKPEVA